MTLPQFQKDYMVYQSKNENDYEGKNRPMTQKDMHSHDWPDGWQVVQQSVYLT